ncbi:LysM peptidoglycan-binding domain-containing protein [Archangium gephyra]|nr:LysM peptidoglycan-binding domain-containing protein [Archangium gephyra]
MTGTNIEYRVRSGDTLYAIARSYNVTVEVLSLNNGISDVNRIRAGQVLKIPKERQSPSSPLPKLLTHRVLAGDTLTKIAQRNNVTVDALTKANGISDPNRIGIGQVLKIPQESQPTAQSTAPSTQTSTAKTSSTQDSTAKTQASTTKTSSTQAPKTAPYNAGKAIKTFGRVRNDDGVDLREKPKPDGTILKRLPFNTRVFVSHELTGDWYFVTLDDGSFGYVYSKYVSINPPDPDAVLHKIKRNEGALAIVKQYYEVKPNEGFRGILKQIHTGSTLSWGEDWGQDERYYANVLVEANRSKKLSGIYKPYASADWDKTQTRENYLIWIPSSDFAKSMRGKVGSGSISHEVWQAAKRTVETIGNYILGHAAFSAGLIHGILESLWDLLTGLVDLVELVGKITKSLITGEFLSDLKKLWDLVEKMDFKALVEVGLEAFRSRWHDKNFLKKWHFRGWVVGYAIAEIVMAVISGAASLVKWAGKAGKFSKLIAKFPKVLELAKKVTTVSKSIPDVTKKKILKAVAQAVERLPTPAKKAASKVDDKKGIPIASGVKEDPGPLLRGAKLGERLEGFLSTVAAGGGMMKVGKRVVSATDLAALTKHTGREFALVILKDNTRALVDMGSYKGGQLPVDTKLLLMHSHPYDHGTGVAKWISEADINALKHFNQNHSYMVTVDGTVYKFTPNTPVNSIGEVVREMHPVLGWMNPQN